MMGYPLFFILVIAGILLPLAAFMVILGLQFLEREMDMLALENKRVQLENELQQSEYLQLNQQIHPHFMFNTLNAFLSLARLGRNEDMIHSMEAFSRFLRYKYQIKSSLIPFDSEMEHTKNYLAIQQLRFGSRLKIEYEIDINAFNTLIPPYTLQTFVENAFKHGLEKKSGERCLTISLSRQGNWVSLKVINNGPYEPTDVEASGQGLGLKNIKKRFSLLFDLHSEISIHRLDSGRTEVRAVWPYYPEGS